MTANLRDEISNSFRIALGQQFDQKMQWSLVAIS